MHLQKSCLTFEVHFKSAAGEGMEHVRARNGKSHKMRLAADTHLTTDEK